MKHLFTKDIRVKADHNNRLIIEHATKFVLEGKWSLTDDHALSFRVRTADSYLQGKTLLFYGQIENVKSDLLRFRVRRSDPLSGIRSGMIELKGKWHADADNRISFSVAKGEGRYDTLKFQGAWQLNKRNELTYRYTETYLKTKTKKEQLIVFRGYWDLEKHRIVYRLDKSDLSFFAFSASLRSKKLRAAEGAVRYNVGIKYSRKGIFREIRQTITIYGTWKLGKDFSLGFETICSRKTRHVIHFQIDELLGSGTSFAVKLKTAKGEKLGAEVTFTKTFKNDAELFLSLGHHAEEFRVMGGVKVKF